MLKNGYLSSRDIIGKGHYCTASGEIVEGTEVNLRSLSIGGLTINGVRASVVHSQNAPILLGQSVLKRFGKYEVDNVKQVVRISE